MLAMMLVCVSGNAQMSVSGRILRADYGLKGTVKSVTEAHWDEDGLFFGRQNNVFSRTGKVLEETVYFGEGENDIESTRLCKYNSDGSLSGCYTYRRGGEAHAVLEHFAHWVAVYDQKGHLVRKHVLEFEPKADKYGNPIWHRTGEEVFAVADGPQASDTQYTFDKKTGRTTTMRWSTDDGDMTATFAYTASGDTLSIVYDDTTGHLPTRVDYEYKYASTLEKEREKNRETARPQGNTGRAVSPVLEKRKQEAAKKSKKKAEAADTLRLDTKTVTTVWTHSDKSGSNNLRTAVRTERYDDSSKLVNLNITRTFADGRKEVTEWRWNAKYQLSEVEETHLAGGETVYQVKDRFSYDRSGDPISRTRSGKSVAKSATWKFFYREYDSQKNWTRRTYVGPASEKITTTVSPKGATIKTISYTGESKEEDTRIIKYY